jgi:predicted secreted Zn-dependent protease
MATASNVTLHSGGEQKVPYTFKAMTLQEAKQNMASLGPKDGDGNHAGECEVKAYIKNLEIDTKRQSTPDMTIYTAFIKNATLEYSFIIRFPNWSNYKSLSKAIINEWERFTKCLWVHERGHEKIAIPIVKEYLKKFQSFNIASASCASDAEKDLRSQIESLGKLMEAEFTEASKNYDIKTRHGRTQGAKLQTNIRRGSRHR